LDLDDLSVALQGWFQNKGFEAQIVDQEEGKVIQARKGDEGWTDWRSWLGVSAALTIEMCLRDENLVVQTGAAKWIDKVGVGIAGVLLAPIFLIPAAYGVWQQSKLPNEVFQYIQQYIAAPPAQAAATQATCPSCGAVVGDAKFCPECGAKMPQPATCPECGAEATPGAKFCPECGTKLAAEAEE
jgi:hypothetical protein